MDAGRGRVIMLHDSMRFREAFGWSIAAVGVAVFGVAFPRAGEAATPITAVWGDTAKMAEDRFGHAMTALADGRVIVVGGSDYGGSPGVDATVEIWDPASGRWSFGRGLGAPRVSHTATLLADGRVLVAGGMNGAELGSLWSLPDGAAAGLSAFEVWDPATSLWTSGGEMVVGRFDHSAILLADGRVLIAGGRKEVRSGSRALDDAEVWIPGAGARSTGRLPRPVASPASVRLADGRALLVDGEGSFLWDPTTGEWSDAGRLRLPREGYSVTSLSDGRALVAGGSECDSCGASASVEIWDPVTMSWSVGAAMGSGRRGHAAALLGDGRVLVAGGQGGGAVAKGERFVMSAEVWDPSTGRWSPAGHLRTGRSDPRMALLPGGGVFIAGGLRASGRRADGSQVFVSLASAEVWRPLGVSGL